MNRHYYFIRHATPEANPASITAADMKKGMAGVSDPPLSPLGRQQAWHIAPVVDSLGVDYILSSNMNRAVETAAVISQSTNIPLGERIEELREFAPGTLDVDKSLLIKTLGWKGWPGPVRKGIDARMYRIMVMYYLLNWKRGNTTGGDTFQGMQKKIAHVFKALESHPGKDLAIVGHGYWIMFMAMAVMGNSKRNFLRLSYVDNCSITNIASNGPGILSLKYFAQNHI